MTMISTSFSRFESLPFTDSSIPISKQMYQGTDEIMKEISDAEYKRLILEETDEPTEMTVCFD